MTEPTEKGQKSAPWVRITILLVALGVICVLSLWMTGSVIPSDPRHAFVFQGALLLVVLGSALLEQHFTKPAESAVNALMGILGLMSVYGRAPQKLWMGTFIYCLVVFMLAISCVMASSGQTITGLRKTIASATYRPAVFLGRARLLFSVLFILGLLSFYDIRSNETLVLLLFWGLFVVIWPLGLPELLSGLRVRSSPIVPIGRLMRTDSPNVVRFVLDTGDSWTHEQPKVFQQGDGKQRVVLPLYSQIQEEGFLGTGLCGNEVMPKVRGLSNGCIYEAPSQLGISQAETCKYLGGEGAGKLVGFVVEDSSISEIRFETWDPKACRDGMVVWCPTDEGRVFYQITDGMNREETLQTGRHGFQVAIAAQLGKLEKGRGFVKFTWLPAMNAPVFGVADLPVDELTGIREHDFVFGTIPGTQVKVGGPLMEYMDHHTAILGVTGSGKTELAFDVIRNCVESGIKVVCIDLTDQYQGRLADLSPVDLSLSSELLTELSARLFDAETGAYGAGKEKKALKEFSDKLRIDVERSIGEFLVAKEKEKRVGLIRLEEISNTPATLYITELYMTGLLHFARDHGKGSPRVLIVVEEAHTVMPEPRTMGLGDYSSQGLVGKIAQIALQGRKYGVGLLVIAQRTATVSKSVLTQCNTVVSFACFDETSLTFLSNVFGASYVKLIPNLPPLHAVVFGKGMRAERPVVVEIPYDGKKAEQGKQS
jgi:hypothetical protein